MNILSLISIIVVAATIAVLLSRRYEATYVLIISNLLIFMISLMAMFVSTYGGLSPVQWDLGFRPVYLQTGENLWTVITHMFVHGSFSHIIMNMLFLLLLGTELENRIGHGRFLSIYFIGGILAMLTECLLRWSPETGFSPVLLIGASGAISALMGALLLLYPHEKISFFLGPIFLPRVKVWLSVGTWFVLQAIFLIIGADMGVAYGAHIGGFIGGVVMARALVREFPSKEGEVDLSALYAFASDPPALQSLEHAIAADEEDVRRVWLEEFAKHARCPRCGECPRLNGNKLKCACGLEVKWR